MAPGVISLSEIDNHDADVRLVGVGHLGFGTEITPNGRHEHLSGSLYGWARGASAVARAPVGLAAQVGDDFPLDSLRQRNLCLSHVAVSRGPSPRFRIVQYNWSDRNIGVELGIAANPHPELTRYSQSVHVHLATMPPKHQMYWYSHARKALPRAAVSVDMLEATVRSDPSTSLRLCQLADLVFLNEDEYRVLTGMGWVPDAPYVLKQGHAGARYVDGSSVIRVAAPKVRALDTTGAGEVLAGVFLTLRSSGVDVREALTTAVRLASESVAYFGVDEWLANRRGDEDCSVHVGIWQR